MSRWFRFYDDVINDPKALKLSDRTFRIWVGMLCLASKNDGVLPSFEDMVISLRVRADKLQPELEKLIAAGLLDHDDRGITPHNWSARQYISDSSAERVKRHREKRAAAGLEPQWAAGAELRKEVYGRDGFKCVYCGTGDDLTIDHRVPEMRGGTHDISNLQTACRACNASKRDLTHDEFVTRNGSETLLKRPQTTEQIRTESKKENGGEEKWKPRHGTVSRYGKIFLVEGTKDWAEYDADEFNLTGKRAIADTPAEGGGTGRWFKITGAAPIPPPKRLQQARVS